MMRPRPDVVSGFAKWIWLAEQRRDARLIDPTIEIRCMTAFRDRLTIGEGAAVDKGCILWIADECEDMARIRIGKKAYVGPYTFLGSCHRLEIGNDTLIGAGSYIITVNHRTDDLSSPFASQGYRGGDVVIGANVWLGAHVVVLPGVSIGDNAIVGAGAVVTKNIPMGARWAGVPAKPLDLGS